METTRQTGLPRSAVSVGGILLAIVAFASAVTQVEAEDAAGLSAAARSPVAAGSSQVMSAAIPAGEPGGEFAAGQDTLQPGTAGSGSAGQDGTGQDGTGQEPVGTASGDRTYRILGVGDMMLGSDWPQPYMDERMVRGGSPADVVGQDLLDLLRAGDITFGNFEGTLHTSSANAKACGNPKLCFTFRSPPWHADYLRDAGFTLLSNANNHARDFGETGRAETFANLAAAGFAVSGGDSPQTRFGIQQLEDGTRAALVAFGHNPGLMQVSDLARVASLVREAGEQADFVIVSCHIGAEGARYEALTRSNETFVGENRGNPFAFARAAVDAGADVVFCHGPHVPRAVEVYKDRFIAYSLGNFWTFGRFNLSGINGYAPVADLDVRRDGSLVAARIHSALQQRPGGPRLDAGGLAAALMARQTLRDLPETGTRIDADGKVSWPGAR